MSKQESPPLKRFTVKVEQGGVTTTVEVDEVSKYQAKKRAKATHRMTNPTLSGPVTSEVVSETDEKPT